MDRLSGGLFIWREDGREFEPLSCAKALEGIPLHPKRGTDPAKLEERSRMAGELRFERRIAGLESAALDLAKLHPRIGPDCRCRPCFSQPTTGRLS